MSATRIYLLEDMERKEPVRLIEATSQATAVRFAASRYKASPASAKDVAQMMGEGTKVELATPEQPEIPFAQQA